MKIIVTGAEGFIGNAVALELHKKGHQVVGTTALSNLEPLEKLRVQRLKDTGVPLVGLDLTSASSTMTGLYTTEAQLANADVLIHFAAMAGVQPSKEWSTKYVQTNVLGFWHILDACKLGPKVVIYASSSSVYGERTEVRPIRETDGMNPQSVYAATKLCDDILAKTYSHVFNIPTVGLRFFSVYGPWGRPDMAYFKFVQQMDKGEPVRLYNNGAYMRDMTYIDDVVKQVVLLTEQNHTGHEIYNVGKGHPVEMFKVAMELYKAMNIPPKIELLDERKDGDPLHTWANTTKLRQRTGTSPQVELREGIERFVAWYQTIKTIL